MALTARVVVEPMRLEDVDAVHEIERLSFRTPWPAYAFEQELRGNRLARYLVARAGERVVGFAGIWMMVDEAHITTFGVHPDWRRQGIGRQLLLNLAEVSIAHRRAPHDARGAGVERRGAGPVPRLRLRRRPGAGGRTTPTTARTRW